MGALCSGAFLLFFFYTHVRGGGGFCKRTFKPPTEALPRWVSQKGLLQNPPPPPVHVCGFLVQSTGYVCTCGLLSKVVDNPA